MDVHKQLYMYISSNPYENRNKNYPFNAFKCVPIGAQKNST